MKADKWLMNCARRTHQWQENEVHLSRAKTGDLPSLQPISANGQRPKKPKSVVGMQTMMNKISANARLNINRFVGVCMPLFSPIPIRTREFPIRPRTKNVLNKQIFRMPSFSPSPTICWSVASGITSVPFRLAAAMDDHRVVLDIGQTRYG